MQEARFAQGLSIEDVENGLVLAPRFGPDGTVPVVATDAVSGDVVMLAYMNAEALELTLETGQAHYWSRSRQELWRKGATSGHTQTVVEARIDCDQDAVWLRITTEGGINCHTGHVSCFYRGLPSGADAASSPLIPVA
jgi:phosphoribosyl-AMP cyclohydrolase